MFAIKLINEIAWCLNRCHCGHAFERTRLRPHCLPLLQHIKSTTSLFAAPSHEHPSTDERKQDDGKNDNQDHYE